jgi:hypothetical protein
MIRTRRSLLKGKLRRGIKDRLSLYHGMILLLVIILLFFLMGFMIIPVSIAKWVPFSLHSSLSADYSADEKSVIVSRLNLGLIIDTLRDQGTPVTWEQVATIQSDLETPVPSVTPLTGYLWTSTPVGGSNPTSTSAAHSQTSTVIPTVIASITPSQGSSTPTVFPDPTLSVDPTATLQYTPLATVPGATATVNIPRITPTRTDQPTKTLSATISAGTNTPTPVPVPTRTNTPTLMPTTLPPPTPTRTPTTLPPPTRTPTDPSPTRTPNSYPPPYP